MATERIADIKLNMERLSDEELTGVIGHQTERLETAQVDLDVLLGYAAMRGLVNQPDPNQLVIEY